MGCKSNCCCCILCVLLFTSPLVIVPTLITLEYVGVKPRFYIQELYIPALNTYKYNLSNLNSSIIIDLKFKRVVAHVPIRYQDLNITLYYGLNRSFAVGRYYVVKEIAQGRKKTVGRRVVVVARGMPWEDVFQRISGGSTVALAVELATKYQLKQCDGDGNCSYGKRKAVVVEGDVAVDGSGVEVSKKPIRLR